MSISDSYGRIGVLESFGVLATLVIVFAMLSSMCVLPTILMGTEKIAARLKRKNR